MEDSKLPAAADPDIAYGAAPGTPEQPVSWPKRFGLFIWEMAKVVIISLAIIVPVRYFLVQPFYVKGASMEPNYLDADYLIIDELSYRFQPPQRGEVVVFHYPRDPSQYFIKRVIGLPGETVAVQDGQVLVAPPGGSDLQALPEPYLPATTQTRGEVEATRLGVDEYFLMGDNREHSLDSRTFGPVNRNVLVGRAWLRGWPVSRIGKLTID